MRGLIVILLLFASFQAPLANAQEHIQVTLEYNIKLSNKTAIFISKEFLDTICNTSIEPKYSITKILNNTILNATFIFIILPYEFDAKINASLAPDGTSFYGNITINLENITIKVVNLSISVNRTSRLYEYHYYNEKILCSNISFKFVYNISYLAGIIPRTECCGYKSVEIASVWFARIGALGNYSITSIYPGNNYCCLSIDLWNKTDPGVRRFSMAPTFIVLGPPPGEEYDCCGLVFAASETIAPAEMVSFAESGIDPAKVLADIVKNETGLEYRVEKIELLNIVKNLYIFELTVDYGGIPIGVLYTIDEVVGGENYDTYMALYHAGYGFLISLDASELDALTVLHSVLSDSFYLAKALKYPLGGMCDIVIVNGSLKESLGKYTISPWVPREFTVSVRLAGMSLEAPQAATIAPGSDSRGGNGGGAGDSGGFPWQAALALAAVAVGVLLVYKRGARERG